MCLFVAGAVSGDPDFLFLNSGFPGKEAALSLFVKAP